MPGEAARVGRSAFERPSTSQISTLSLHDALPISPVSPADLARSTAAARLVVAAGDPGLLPRGRSEEHTSELQSANISYAVFCLKKQISPVPAVVTAGNPRSARDGAARLDDLVRGE